METTLIAIVIAVLIFAIAVWAVGVLPLPSGAFPIKTVLYVLAAVVLIIYLLRYV